MWLPKMGLMAALPVTPTGLEVESLGLHPAKRAGVGLRPQALTLLHPLGLWFLPRSPRNHKNT